VGLKPRISLPVHILAARVGNPGNAAATTLHSVRDLVEDQTDAVLQVVIDVQLHETARERGDGVQDNVRGALWPFPYSSLLTHRQPQVSWIAAVDPASWLDVRSRILNNDGLQRLLRNEMAASEKTHDMIRGMYRMNRAGRSRRSRVATDSKPTAGAASAEGLVTADDCHKDLRIMGNLDCLFIHLRDCPSLFSEPPDVKEWLSVNVLLSSRIPIQRSLDRLGDSGLP
jgi:hypothetical protein